MPAPDARAAVVVDAATGEVLYARNATEELHPASLTKMVTALTAVERAPLDKLVRPTHDYDVTPVVIGIGLGDSLPLRDVLYGLLLNSGNDAALAIAEAVGDGSIDRFVGWMNGVATGLHLEHTHFKNPHGLDTDGHVSTAYDESVIGRAVMRQPVLASIVGTPRHVVDGPPRWVFQSINPLLGNYPGVDGIKTGFDDLAGRCLVATATRDGRRAVAVVMHSDNYADDAASLLDYAFADPHWRGTVAAKPPGAGPSSGVTARVAALRADLDGADGSAPATLVGAASDVRWIGQGERVFIAP
jgi:D-alanyl-D-alanine carboxypeptidase (penicillin-binding protein 5/6)